MRLPFDETTDDGILVRYSILVRASKGELQASREMLPAELALNHPNEARSLAWKAKQAVADVRAQEAQAPG